ncbi:DUF1850 domain-containing protein [Bacillus sp. SB49]|uniref:DUF1850 domain-containing protein n=1 Tax=Bacillus sp. SB49 TaxID=1071080 RepID=UPI000418C65F|nr:DUF1850 domain-containing protein [Bacillus sp. SB49]QHT47727.1 DUF1850 domain-containing protein [Bacillus sp. SB49]
MKGKGINRVPFFPSMTGYVRAVNVAAVCFLLLTLQVHTLTVSSESMEECFFIKDGTELSIRWTHSVENEDWEETFLMEQDKIRLINTRFKTFGAGVPNDIGTETYVKDGWVYMEGISRNIGEQLIVRTGDRTNHGLRIGNREQLDLASGEAFKIAGNEISLLSMLVRNTIK